MSHYEPKQDGTPEGASADSQLSFGHDAHGQEVLLMRSRGGDRCGAAKPYVGGNTVVMMEWEKPYMERLVASLQLSPLDDVLEIGFGCGYSALAIQEAAPRTHCIIECDPLVLQRARRFAEFLETPTIVEGTWQAVLGHTENATDPLETRSFTAVFFDDFPLPVMGAGGANLSRDVSRWCAFLGAVVHRRCLKDGARVTGYLARELTSIELEEIRTIGFEVSGMDTTEVEPSPLCPYFNGKAMYVPIFVYRERKTPSSDTKCDSGSQGGHRRKRCRGEHSDSKGALQQTQRRRQEDANGQ